MCDHAIIGSACIIITQASEWARSWHAGPPRSELQGVDHDCNDIPDAAMTLAVAALFAKGQTRIRNVYNWRVKACTSSVSMLKQSFISWNGCCA